MIVLLLITTLVISFQHARASWTIRQLRFEPAPSSSPFPGEIMAYVTPWNAAGYDNAKKMAKKLDWVSPVWFQIR